MRTFFKSIIGIVIICILGAVIFLFLAWSRVPDMVSTRLSKSLKVMVSIGDMHLSMNQLKVDNLEIGNPPGYKLEHAFTAQEILVNAPLTSYLHDDIVIDEIDVNNVYIGLEFKSPKGTEGNWTTLMHNAKTSQEKSSQSKSEKTVLIKRLLLTNIQADLLYQSEGKVKHLPTIPQIELKNISSQGGDLSDQLMNTALGKMIKEIFVKENMNDVLDKIFKVIPGGDSTPVNILKGLFSMEEEILDNNLQINP